MNVDPLAVHNPVMENQFYGDGQHNGGVYYWGNLNPYIYTYQNPIIYIDPNGKQSHWSTVFMSESQKAEFNQHYPYVSSHGGSVFLMKRANDYRIIANRFTTRAANFESSEPVLKLNGPLDEPDIGSDRGAFRHAYWSSLLYKNDKEQGHIITDAHETWNISAVPSKDMRTTFNLNEIFLADNYVDELNNRVGRNVAFRHPGSSNKELAQLTAMEFYLRGLYKLKKQGNQLKIYRGTLDKKDYESLFNRFGTLSNEGKDPKDKK